MPNWKKVVVSGSDALLNSLEVSNGASGSFSGSFEGDGSGLTGVDPFPFTGDAQITGSLTISGSFSSFTLDSDNVVLGAGSGTSMEAGANSNIIVGSNTATSLTTGDFNIILGDSAGAADTNSQKNVLIGQRAGGNATSLSENIFIGNGAGRYGSGLGGNVGVGQDALKGTSNNNGDNNVGIGWQSGLSIEDGTQNVFVGYRSAEAVTTGNYNVIIGKKSGLALTTGGNNIFVGPDAGGAVETGDANIIIGSGSAGAAAMSNQLRIGNGESVTVISASLATGDIIFYNTASAPNFSGSFQGDGSGLTNITVITASYALTASYVETAQTASYVLNAISSSFSSFALTASYVNPLNQDVIITGSLTVSGSNSVVNLQELQFDTEHSASGHTTGRIYWDDNNKTFTGDMQGSDVRLQIGQEEHVYVFNNSGVTINNGDAVRISGANGANVTVTKAISSIKSFKDATEQDQILGLATEQIPDNQRGYVTTFGGVRDLDTSAFSEGDILYLSAITSGSYSNTRPAAPNFEARVGVVQIANATEGVVLVRPQEPTFLTDISQITSSGVITNEKTYLVYDDSTDLISFTNEFSGSFSGSFQGKLGPISNTTYRLTSSLYTASAADYRIGVKYTLTGSVSIQLPLISNVGEIEYKFKDEEGNAKKNSITIVASGSNLIDGDVNAILNRNYMAISLYNDGVSNWFIE